MTYHANFDLIRNPQDRSTNPFSLIPSACFRLAILSDPILLEVALYRSWLIDQRGCDLDRAETEQLLHDTHAPARLRATVADLLALLEESMKPEHRAALKSLREKTGFDEQVSTWLARVTATRPA